MRRDAGGLYGFIRSSTRDTCTAETIHRRALSQSGCDDPGEYQPMIDAAVQAVANEVERILDPPDGNVVPMRKVR